MAFWVLTLGTGLAASGSTLRLLQTRASLEGAARAGVTLEPGAALKGVLDGSASPKAVPSGLPAGRAGSLETVPLEVAAFDTAVVSWNALTPPGTWLLVEARARVQGRWTRYYRLGSWSTDAAGPSTSYEGQRDADGRVDTDTLVLAHSASALEIRVTLGSNTPGRTPTLTGLAAVTSDSSQHKRIAATPSDRAAWGLELAVPAMSQMIYPNGGEVWCSPTSTTMLLAYWGLRLDRPLADAVPAAAGVTWDAAYGGAGNWPFNTAYASSKGLRAYVTRLSSLAEAEAFIRRGVPLALSIAWGRGELEGAHVPSVNGHLVVLRGFTAIGDPIINDPAARSDAAVRTVYRRAQLERAWVGHSGGIVYVVHPPDWP